MRSFHRLYSKIISTLLSFANKFSNRMTKLYYYLLSKDVEKLFKFSNEFKVSTFFSYRKFPINPFDPRSKSIEKFSINLPENFLLSRKRRKSNLSSPLHCPISWERKNTRFHWIGTTIELWVNEPLIRRLIREIGSLPKLAVSALTWSVHTRHLSRCLVHLGAKASLIGRDIKAVSSLRSVTWSFGGSRNKMADANEAWVQPR